MIYKDYAALLRNKAAVQHHANVHLPLFKSATENARAKNNRLEMQPLRMPSHSMDYMGMADRRKFYIPCLTQGLNVSTFPGVLEEVSKCISEYEAEHK